MGSKGPGPSPVRAPPGSPTYPASLARHLAGQAPACLAMLGNAGILGEKKVALFCSVHCPGELIVKTYDLARAFRDAGVTVIGGFQSPMEKECLELLLRGTQPVIICPARSLDHLRLPGAWASALAGGRLLLLSGFQEGLRRPTTLLAQSRNELVAALADEVLIAYAEPGGRTEAFARTVLGWGKPVLTLESKDNAALIALGARPFNLESIAPKTD